MKRTILIYLALLALFGSGIFFAIRQGQHLPAPSAENPLAAGVTALPSPSDTTSLWSPLSANLKEPLGRLLLQVIVILLATRAVGAVFARCGQPSVVGEVLAGILLGPSLLGWLWPAASGFIFPTESLGVLRLLSQIGVCLFMFVVGLEMDLNHLRQKAHTAVLVSHIGILVSFFLGVVTALFVYSNYSAPGTSFTPFALFMGIAMSITAFPVLAHILKERGIAKTFLGSTALTCAAVNDATAWAILAFVVATAHAGNFAITAFYLALVVVFVAVMLFVVRPQLPRWLAVERLEAGGPKRGAMAAVLLLILAAALTTELIGIRALFGAFLAGVVMPQKKEFREYLIVRLENFSSLFLLPLFFAFSGLRTHVGLLNDTTSWLVCLAIIAVATLGKLGGTMVTARLTGMNWNDAFALGALMNTRGLVELVALNIGYDLGILPPRIFAMMVLMALVTTFLTGPLLNLAERAKRRGAPAVATS
ncbi:MAG: cation/H(+) antiporter [Pedosphaera sp.]|nr:cation/H(+) antiporter [Pedosphaera sp.]